MPNKAPLSVIKKQPQSHLGRRLVGWIQTQFYKRAMRVEIVGAHHIPDNTGFLVAANHCSHLDAGLVKYALGDAGQRMVSLAAKDYFFGNPILSWYFRNFTNLMPLERQGTFKSTLRQALGVLRQKTPILIFPEGTRSRTGAMAPFKPAIGSMSMSAEVPVLPMFLMGTYQALPKGRLLVPRARSLRVVIGPPIPAALLQEATQGLAKREASRVATLGVEMAVRALESGQLTTPEMLRDHLQTRQHTAQALAG